MVAIVSGIRNGLNLTSAEVLGFKDVIGGNLQGRNGQAVNVNVALGQVVLQGQDDLLVARGDDAPLVRTYNSNGSFNDDNGDGWSSGVTMLRLSGAVNTVGSTIQRVEADGGAASYSYDAARALYVSTEGGGAYDTVAYVAGDGQYEWRDGSTGVTQRYEGAGTLRLLASKDASGNTVTFSYGANGFLSSVTTANGDSVLYDYVGNNLSQVRTTVDGVTTTRVRYGYDTSNRLATVTLDLTPGDNSIADGKVYQTTYGYDGTSKRVASITQSDGTSVAFTYIDVGGGNFKVETVRDALNQTTRFTYGTRITTVTDPLGLVTRYDYDAAGQISTITAPAIAGISAVRQFAYDAAGNVISVTDGETRAVTYQYDDRGNQVLQRDAAGNTVTRTFDARNQLLSQTTYTDLDPDGAGPAVPVGGMIARQVYDAGGRNQLRFAVSAEGRVTEYRYDGFGQRVATVTYGAGMYPFSGVAPDSAFTESALTTWTASQDLASTQREDLAYDVRGQLKTRTRYTRVAATGEGIADGSHSVERYVYDPAGLLLQTIDGRGAATSYTYDGLGRTRTATDALGRVTVSQYDDAARKTVVTMANGLVTTSSYDTVGRVTSVAQFGTGGTALGETRYFYDADNRLRMTQDPTGVRHWTFYDEAGRKTADIDGNGSMTETVYDRRDLVIGQVTWGTAVNVALLVDVSGAPLLSLTAASVRPSLSANDYTVWRQYDAAGLLVREASSTGAAQMSMVKEFRYDGAGRMAQTVRYATPLDTAGTGNVAFGAVALPPVSAQDRIERHFYDADGRITGTLDAEGYLTTFKYSAGGQLYEKVAYATATSSALRSAGTLAQLLPASSAWDMRELTFFDAQGRVLASVDAEGYASEFVYDASGNLTQSVRYASRATVPTGPQGTPMYVRPAANPADRSTLRSYDSLNRLAQETSAENVVTQFAYDTVGNLVSTVKAVGSAEVRSLLARYDLQGRLTAELSAEGAALLTGGQTQPQVDAVWAQYGTTFTYDAASRRTSSTDPLGNRTWFFYDADGSLTHTVNALGEVRESRYDARGRLVDSIAYLKRISTSALTGGLVTDAFTAVVAAVADTGQDSRTTYTYTRESAVASTTDAIGSVTGSTYNVFGEAIGRQVIGTAVNLVETYTVDRRGQRTGTVRDAAGVNAATSVVYDAFGREVRSVDANGNLREQGYDRVGRVVLTRDPLNAARTTSYDAFGRVLTQTDTLGNVTRYAYDPAARSMTVTTAEGIATTTTYTRHGQVLSVADGNGQLTTYVYDPNGNLVRTVLPQGVTSNTYDAAGRLTETTDANGNKVAYGYDAANRVLTRRVDPLGLNLVTSWQYDGKGQRVSVTDANSFVTTLEYDRKGRVLKQTIDPSGLNLQTVYTYDATGNVLTVRSPAGSITQYVYDALGRRVQERVDPAGLNLQRNWSYDRNGNVIAAVDARGNATRYAYDAADRLAFTVDPLGDLRRNAYDAEGRVVKTVAYASPVSLSGLGATPTADQIAALVMSQAAQDVVEHRVFDRDGRLAAALDGTGAVVRYTYDANGNVVGRTAYATRVDMATWVPGTLPIPVADALRDASTRTVYDTLNRAIYTVDGIGAVVAQAYDANGNVVQRTAYATAIPTNVAPTQAAISSAVAAVANVGRDATVRYTYDAAGRIVWSVDGTGAVTQNVYDKNGNVVRQVAYTTAVSPGAAPSTVSPSVGDRAAAMAYDAANRLVFKIDALRGVTEQVFDGDGHVTRRTAYANPIATVPPLGLSTTAPTIRSALTADTSMDRSTRYGYDAAGRQVMTIDATGAATETQYDGAGNVIAVTSYAKPVDIAGLPENGASAAMKARVVTSGSTDRVARKAYDAAGQLVYAVDPSGAVTGSQYDGVGRLTRTARYAVTVGSGIPNTAAGILAALGAPDARDQFETFTYNAAGLRVSSTDALGRTESFGYDALGRKLSFVNKMGFTWTYTYDADGRMLTETTPTVQLTSVSADASGGLVASAPADANVVTRFAYDALGNLTQRTEAAGRLEERTTRYEYDPLGRQVRIVFPPVGVYDAAEDAVTTNGAAGLATRVEATKSLATETFYDALGNAVANKDVGDAISQKAYDVLGRLAYEVDALGFVTGYTRNTFGEVTSLVRYGSRTTLADVSITHASQAAGKAQVEAALATAGFDHSKDRVLVSAYDRMGRLVEKTEPAAYVYDSTGTGQAGTAGRKTRNTYDAFGQAVETKVLRNATTQTWSTTTHYFDLAGRETATVDALGYVTVHKFDAMGNLIELTEYANAVPPGWSPSSFSLPVVSTDDRTTKFTYDRLNRKSTETRWQVEFSAGADGTSARGELTTIFGYDAVGNQTRVTDAKAQTTYTYYDAVGRVKAVAAPARSSTVAGTSLTPLTTFWRDAYGNVLVTTEHAKGASSASDTAFQAPATDPADRRTLTSYDSFGHSTQVTDANGANTYYSHDPYGHVTKQWQPVTGNDGVTRTAFQVSAYDKLGNLTETRTPSSTSQYQAGVGVNVVSQAEAGLVVASTEYNAFGEVARKWTQGIAGQEYFDYDNAGRLWRTNTGDGVDRINLYDVVGNVTAEIRSSGSGRDNVDLKTFASAQAAADNPYTRRVEMQYDLLGRITGKLEAVRQELQGGVSVQRQYTTASVAQTASSNNGKSNIVALSWTSLAPLGSGDVRVTLEYRTPVLTVATPGTESTESGTTTSGGTFRTYTSGVIVGDAALSGMSLQWTDPSTTWDMGVGSISRITVAKKDRNGNWVNVIDQAQGYGDNEILVAAPPDPSATVSLQLRAAGSPGDTGWWSAGLNNFGAGLRFNAAGLATGNYEYRVLVTSMGDAGARVTATGTVAITMPPLNTITAPLRFGGGSVPAWALSWTPPAAGDSQVFRYRASGSTGAWSQLNVIRWLSNNDGVDTSALPPGTYQFELLWTLSGQNTASSHATGIFTIVPPVPATYVAPVNLPPINGVSMGTGTYGGTLIGVSESGGGAYSGGTTVPALVWPAANAILAQYRAAGGSWVNLPLDNAGQTIGESGATGIQKALFYGVGPGTYETRIFAGQPPTAQATGVVTIYAKNPDYYVTVYVQVPTYTPVVSYYAPVYETRYAQRLSSYTVWVPYTAIFGYTESGAPIYGTAYRQETQYYWETYSYQVQVGQTPVYAKDEAGNIIYQVSYVTQAQQKLVTGTTPAPTYGSNTPPYTPGYWVPGVGTQYNVSVTTTSGSGALSGTSGSAMGQTVGMNGDARWQRPAVMQKFDRWGNVVEITDPRAAYWKTTYRFNANNQMVQQVLPDAGRGAATTSIYYDALGRQVAVRDARGFVNGQEFDAGGNLTRELHADTGVVTHAYDAFGQKVRTIDAENKAVLFSYDRMGHLLQIDKGVAMVYRGVPTGGVEAVANRMVSDKYTYDQLGRKLSQTNGNAETLSYVYDLSGNVIATRQPMGQTVRAAFDAQGRKIAETDANGATGRWSYDYFGQLKEHFDLDGQRYLYGYDNARQLTSQNSTRGQSISYSYDAAGQLTTITDWATGKTTSYVYDLAGRKVRERVVQGGSTFQDNNLAYDARGNLRDVADGRAHIVMEYDQVGNRTRVATFVDYQGVWGEAASGADRYFQYDAMNRQVVVDADANGNLGTQGHQITYDRNGNRTRDVSWGTRVTTSGGQKMIIGYDEDSNAIYSQIPVTYSAAPGYSTEEYRYDALNRLSSVERDGLQIDVRQYDGADRVIQSGPGTTLAVRLADLINRGLPADQVNGKETRQNRYDANGRLMHQTVLKSDNTLKLNISWDTSETASDLGITFRPDGYDAAGNVLGYTVTNHEAGVINKYTTSLARFDGYQALTTHGQSTKQVPGDSTQQYDVNGNLVGIVDSTQPANNRTFVNDATGKALYVNQAGNVQRQLIVNGEVLGLYGAGVDPNAPATGYTNNPNFANIVDFDFGYARISANYPSASPGAYTVRAGDTLQSISQSAYGDSALWYRIAEANGLASNNDLRVGQTLNIPNRVSTINNNSTTFKPYDPSKIEGDKTPSLATPEPPKKKGNLLGKLLMVIVAIVVTLYTAGAMSGAVGGFFQTVAAGAEVVGGAAGTAAAASSSLTTAGTLAVAAAAGSAASQLVGMVTGNVQKFDWNSVALSAVSAGVSAGLPTDLLSGLDLGKYGSLMARAAVANAITQSVGVVTGLQARFDWRGVAGSAAGAAAGEMVGNAVGLAAMGRPADMRVSEFVGKAFAKGVAAGLATTLARGGRVAVQQIAVDAFGNAFGQSLADASNGTGTGNASQRDSAGANYLNELHPENDAAWAIRQQADLSRTSGEFTRADGAGYRGTPYEPAFTGRGLQVANGGQGVKFSPELIHGWSDEIDGGVALRSARDAEIDAAAAAAKAQREALARRRAAQAATRMADAGAGREFISPSDVNPYASAVTNAPLPAGWNMRDAHAASVAAARQSGSPGDFGRGFSGQYRSVLEGDGSVLEDAGRLAGAAVNSLKNFAYAASGARAMDAAQASWSAGNRATALLQGLTAFGDAGLTITTAGEFGLFKAAAAVDSAVVRAGTVAADGVRNAAAKLRGLGVPDWNIGLRYEPSAVYSNPLPLSFERFGNSSTSILDNVSTQGIGFNSARELRSAMSPGAGEHIHHVVEQTPANIARFGEETIHNTANAVPVVADVHIGKGSISAYYSSKQPFTQGQTVRQWLAGQSFDDQYRFGVQTLNDFGVLQ